MIKMITFQDTKDLPKKSEISYIHSDEKFIFYYGEETFMNFIKKDNEVLVKIVCEDGFILFYRTRK